MPTATLERGNAELEKALDGLRRIENARREIVALDNAKLNALQELQRSAQSVCAQCDAALNDETDVDTFRQLLDGWAKNFALLKPLEQLVISQSRTVLSDQGRVGRLRKEFPDLRGPLIRVCELRIEQAQAESERLTSEEAERLGPDDAQQSPPVKRQANRVQHLKAVLQRVTQEPIEQVWTNFVSQLL
jgi:hypothetical protein